MDKRYEVRDGAVYRVEDVSEQIAPTKERFNQIYPSLEEKAGKRDQYLDAARRIDAEIISEIESAGLDKELLAVIEPEKSRRLGFFNESSTS